MAWDEGLDGPHLEIARENARSLWIVAGPGTGKTFAMMRRVARLLEEEEADPVKVLAVTFTRTAAGDLRRQLQQLGIDGADRVRATTLHALCFGALSRDQAFEQIRRHARPLLSYERDALVQDLAGTFEGKRDVRARLLAFEAGWARLQRDDPGWAQDVEDARFETELLSWLRFHRAMLIGELVPLALRHLRTNPTVRLFDQYDHVLVDEFQDLNKADQALVTRLAAGASLTVIGDDNQSIYSFRHANPQGIREYPTHNPGTVAFEISWCRRCPPNLVAMSNALIAHDPDRLRAVPLMADGGRPDASVYVVQHESLEDEVQTVADFIDHYLEEHPDMPPGHALVLSPRRFMGQAVKDALIARGRQSLSFFAEDELSAEEAALGFCLLTLLVRPGDRAAMRAWLGFGSSSQRTGSYLRLRDYCSGNSVEPRDALQALSDGTLRIPYALHLVRPYEELVERLEAIEGLEGLDLVDALWPEAPEVQDLRLMAQRLALDSPQPNELLGLLQQEITQPELPGVDDDVIRVMSLHKSKGLTARLVVVIGCVSGAIPTVKQDAPDAVQEAQFSEQRRLFYVAITRPKDVLVLSGSTTMTMRDAMRANIQHAGIIGGPLTMVRTRSSPFLGEMGATLPTIQSGTDWRATVGF